jgi:hypothetical protein
VAENVERRCRAPLRPSGTITKSVMGAAHKGQRGAQLKKLNLPLIARAPNSKCKFAQKCTKSSCTGTCRECTGHVAAQKRRLEVHRVWGGTGDGPAEEKKHRHWPHRAGTKGQKGSKGGAKTRKMATGRLRRRNHVTLVVVPCFIYPPQIFGLPGITKCHVAILF